MRNSLIDVMDDDFVITARAKGVRDKQVLWDHRRSERPAADDHPDVPVARVHLRGRDHDRSIFSWPGLGLLTVQAIGVKDFPLLQGLFLLFSTAVIFANLIADIGYSYLDPRVRAA